MARKRLPDRHPSETKDLWFNGVRHDLTVGYYVDGRPGEVFLHGAPQKIAGPSWPRNDNGSAQRDIPPVGPWEFDATPSAQHATL